MTKLGQGPRPWLELAVLVPLLFLPTFLVRFSFHGLAFNLLDIILAIATIIGVILGPRGRVPAVGWWVGGGVILAGVISTAIAPDKHLALGALKSWIVLPVIYGWTIVSVRPKLARVQRTLLLTVGYTSLNALWSYWLYESIAGQRLQGWYDSPNFFAMFVVPVLIVTVPLLSERSKWVWVWRVIWLMGLVALGLTVSFGGFFAILVGGAMYFALGSGRNHWARAAVIVMLALLVVLPFVIPLNASNPQHLLKRSDSLKARSQIWHVATLLVAQEPILGIGLRQFEARYDHDVRLVVAQPVQATVPEPHNLFLAWWLNLGLLGLASFLAFYVWLARNVDRFAGWTTAAVPAALVSVIAHGAIDTSYFQNDLSVLFFTFVAVAVVTTAKAGARSAE